MANRNIGRYEKGIFRKGNVRISDLSGRKMLPIGSSNFAACVRDAVFVDKSMLIADVLDSGSVATLFCRPRRFGKSLNLSMLQRFFETPVPGDMAFSDMEPLFSGLAIWDAKEGRYREHQGAYPVIRLSFNDAKGVSWDVASALLRNNIVAEYLRHGYLSESERLNESERNDVRKVIEGAASETDLRHSLKNLSRYLSLHHGAPVVVLIDEYDAPVMSGYTHGYYDEVVGFLKSWLTGALKDNDALAFAVLTGVQRISKESIFSDLNNLMVNTALNVASDERYGFTPEEVEALAEYLGASYAAREARAWYDGYRFGAADIYNPWSIVNYFQTGCAPDVYWGNTSSNLVLGELVRHADSETLEELYVLMEPGGTIRESLDLSVVFPDVGVRSGALWSMLYLSGYLTTEDTNLPNNTRIRRALRVPNAEIRELYRKEIVERFAEVAGGGRRLVRLHEALVKGDAPTVKEELSLILASSASFFDLVSENSYHMLMMGLLFGVEGYEDPLSNREAGLGRFDIRLAPSGGSGCPHITLELKHEKAITDGNMDRLKALAEEALRQIAAKGYDETAAVESVLRYGIAFSGKHVAVAVDGK